MGTGDVLDRLNASERELLLLLGRGHTAKSIAALKDLSELAVNERFRSARRKTGIGSSREIARLLVAQENRDDFIGLVEPAARPSDIPRPDAPRRASLLRRWSLPVSATAILIASAILAQQTAVAPSRPIPPAAAAIFAPREPSPDVAALHAEIAADATTTAWSAETTAVLAQAYRQLPDFNDRIESLDVTCNTDLCEVVGVSRQGLDSDRTNALMASIQSREINEIAAGQGLDLVVQSFNSSRDDGVGEASAATVFVAYWRRRTD